MRQKTLTVGKIFWDAMKRNGFSVNDAAEFCEVSRITIYNWKTGRHPIPEAVFWAILNLENEYHEYMKKRKKALAGGITEQDAKDGQKTRDRMTEE